MAQDQARATADVQRELALDRERREDARATYGLFITGIPDTLSSEGGLARLKIMLAYCNDSANARAAIVTAACKHLPAEPVTAGQRRAVLQQAVRWPDEYLNSDLSKRANIAAAAIEAAEAPEATAGWFAVVGTVPLDSPGAARSLAGRLGVRLSAAGINIPIRLYRTEISRSFAISAGGPRSQAEATRLARRIRASGVVADAFAQPDRRWTATSL